MHFKVGDSVIYPRHGAATIIRINSREVHGESKQYLTLKMAIDELEIQVPEEKLKSIGVRNVVDDDGVRIVFDILTNDPPPLKISWAKHFKENVEKTTTGNIYDIAEVIKDLVHRGNAQGKGLSAGEKRMLHRSSKVLITELSISLSKSRDELIAEISEMLKVDPEYFC